MQSTPSFVLMILLGSCAAHTPTLPKDPGDESMAQREDRGLQAALAEASAGVTDPALAELLSRHWRWTLELSPSWATQLGVHDFDEKISDPSLEATAEANRQGRAFLAEAKELHPESFTPEDQITWRLFVRGLEDGVASETCRFSEWTLSARSNPVTTYNYLPELHDLNSMEDARSLLARYHQVPTAIDATVDALRSGAQEGLVANAESMERVIEMVRTQLSQDLAEWPLVKIPSEQDIPGAEAPDQERFRRTLTEVVATQIKPALSRYHDALESLLPTARNDESPGLASLPLGPSCYQARVHAYTTSSRSAQEIHALGMSEIETINSAMADLGAKLFDAKDLPTTLEILRSDSSLYFDNEEEVEQAAQQALDAARQAMPGFFGRLPNADCVVQPIPDYEAPYTTIAYYRQPDADGSKAGEYFINTFAPTTRPRFEAKVLAYHESIPGHHLQIAIAQELPAVPAFRRHGGYTVFVEGWALYTERLADEMGLYDTDLDRMGMLSFDAWRASRLVVDTGLHSLGWSRQHAKDFLMEHTALTPGNIDNEVDRYITWPGQALAYKIGQLELLALRQHAQEELADAFDLKGFHDAVLGGGAVDLEVLRQRVEAWVAERKSGPPSE